jgi:hypothetical protein
LGILGSVEDIEILFALALRPGFDEYEQLSAGDSMGKLKAMGRQLVAGRLPLLACPGRQESKLVVR